MSILGNELHIAHITIANNVNTFSVENRLLSYNKISREKNKTAGSKNKTAGSFVVYTPKHLYTNIVQQLTASRLYEKHKKTRMSLQALCLFLKLVIPTGYHGNF